jgi:endonuclease/exonuclease/phosphatase (EEP) superfamily protein YafD
MSNGRLHIRSKTLALLLLVLIVSCRAGGVSQLSDFSERDAALSPSIRIVDWNTQKGRNSQFRSDLAILIERYEPDIVFLQEARADLLETYQMGGYFAEGWSYPWPGGTTIGVMTLSKVAPLEIKPIPSKYREFCVTAPKVSLMTKLPLPNGDTLLAANVHLLAFERWGTKKLRSQLDDLKSIMADHKGPIIMAGDFNTWREKRLELVRELAKELNLQEVTEFPPGRTTADMRLSCLNWIFGIEKDLPLDRLYYRGFTDYSAELLPYDSSDHRAILVTLTLKPKNPVASR